MVFEDLTFAVGCLFGGFVVFIVMRIGHTVSKVYGIIETHLKEHRYRGDSPKHGEEHDKIV